MSRLILKLRETPQPVIAAVNGPAAGFGFALALGSDIRYAAPEAVFRAVFLNMGVSNCDMGTSWLLPRLIGASRAHELMLTGRRVRADEAERIGLVAEVGRRRRAARALARGGGADRRVDAVGDPADEAGDVGGARDRLRAGGDRVRGPPADHGAARPRSRRGDDRVPGEATGRVRGLIRVRDDGEFTAMNWSDEVDSIIDGDLTAGAAYVTPAGGVVVTAVAPVGLRDRAAGTVGFTTSLGLGKKLERIKRNPKIALAYHAREHGFADSDMYVLVQGIAKPVTDPDRDYLENDLGPKAERFMGPPKRGVFWDRWLQAYYADRVPVRSRSRRCRRGPAASW